MVLGGGREGCGAVQQFPCSLPRDLRAGRMDKDSWSTPGRTLSS